MPQMPAPMALQAPIPEVNSRVVRIKAVFTVDGETEDDDYTDVLDDMKQGCGAHGTVVAMFIVRPAHQGALPACGLADVFVEFGDTTGAGTCIGKMTGRKY